MGNIAYQSCSDEARPPGSELREISWASTPLGGQSRIAFRRTTAFHTEHTFCDRQFLGALVIPNLIHYVFS